MLKKKQFFCGKIVSVNCEKFILEKLLNFNIVTNLFCDEKIYFRRIFKNISFGKIFLCFRGCGVYLCDV